MGRGDWSGWGPAGTDWPAPEETLEVVGDTEHEMMQCRHRIDPVMTDISLAGKIQTGVVEFPFSEHRKMVGQAIAKSNLCIQTESL